MKVRIAKAAAVLLLLAMNSSVGTAAGNEPAETAELINPTVLVFGLGSRCRYCVQLKKEIDLVTEKTGTLSLTGEESWMEIARTEDGRRIVLVVRRVHDTHGQ